MRSKAIIAALFATIVGGQLVLAETVKIDACSLIGKADIEVVMGKLKGPAKADTGIQGEKTCEFTNEAGQWSKISVYGADRWGMQKGSVSEMKPTALAKLGEEAFWVQRGSSAELYVRKGKYILEVDSSGGIKFAKPIAEKAIGNLK